MSRAALRPGLRPARPHRSGAPRWQAWLLAGLMVAVVQAAPLRAQSVGGGDPHLDRGLMPRPCGTCHQGHGSSRSPMLPEPQQDLCLSCHGSSASASQAVARGQLSASARPELLASTLADVSTHPMTAGTFSRTEAGAVTCTSCHSPHRGSRQARTTGFPGRRKVSPRDPRRFEFELCEDCHGNAGVTTQSLTDISRVLDPNNRSFHPVEAPASESAPSVIPSLAGREINCTDCHGNDNPQGPKGPHGSNVRFLLRWPYTTVDGSAETAAVYQLCYGCHDRNAVLSSTRFPEHRLHIVGERASCATCHNPHGSVGNRALIRFGEETFISGVSPSASTGRLEFISDAPGSGTCYLTCHGEDHAPESYGAGAAAVQALEAADRFGLPTSAGSPGGRATGAHGAPPLSVRPPKASPPPP